MRKLLIILAMIIFVPAISSCAAERIYTGSNYDTESVINSRADDRADIQADIEMDGCKAPLELADEESLCQEVKIAKEKKHHAYKSELDISYYYRPTNVPVEYEFDHIIVAEDSVSFIYVKEKEEYDLYKSLQFTYIENASLTLERIIEGWELEQSKFSDKLYFWYESYLDRYSIAFFKSGDDICFLRFPYDLDLEDEKQVKMLDEMCQMEKHMID